VDEELKGRRAVARIVPVDVDTRAGSAFAITATHALTAFHCVGRREGAVVDLEFEGGARIRASAVHGDGDSDLALLELNGSLPRGFEPLMWVEANEAMEGRRFVAEGFGVERPPGSTAHAVDGHIVRLTRLFDKAPALQLNSYQLIAGENAHQFSGGPVLVDVGTDRRAALRAAVGVVRWQRERPDSPGQATGGDFYATPVSLAVELWPTFVHAARRVPDKPEPAYRATLRVVHHWTPDLRDRDEDLTRIRAFAMGATGVFGANSESSGYVWLVGGPWAGKTALVAEAVHRLAPDVDVVAYFLIARESDASREQFLAAVVPQLAWVLGEDVPSAIDLAILRDLWARAAAQAARLHRHLLLVVDALDEDLRPAGASVAAALPTENLGGYARVLVTSRLYPELPDDVIHHPLRTIKPSTLTDSPHATQLKVLAEQELHALLARDRTTSGGLAFDVLGLLTAAAGPLSINDLAAMMKNVKLRDIREFVSVARSLKRVRHDEQPRFEFAHQTLFKACQDHPDVGGDPEYRRRLNAWADEWSARNWAGSDESQADIPRYLLETYPATLYGEPERLVTLVCDVGWIDAAVMQIGVDPVLAIVRDAARLAAPNARAASMLRLLRLQAHHLRAEHPTHRVGQTATQLAWEALRVGNHDVTRAASDFLHGRAAPQLIPVWTTERTSRHLTRTVGRHVTAVAATAEGKVVSGDQYGVVRLWDPDLTEDPGRELGRHEGPVSALAVTAQGKVVSAGWDGVVRLIDPELLDGPGRELCRRHRQVRALAITSEGKIISVGNDGDVRLWDPEHPDDPARELGRHHRQVRALAITSEGKIISVGNDGVVRLWDPEHPDDPARELGRHHGRVAAAAMAVSVHGKIVIAEKANVRRSSRSSLESATRMWQGVLRLWDPEHPDNPGRELGRHDDVIALAATAQGEVISAGSDGVVRWWNPDLADNPGRESGRQNRPARPMVAAITPRGQVVSGGVDGVLRLWDPNLPDDPGREVGRHVGAVYAIAVTPLGKIVSDGEDGVVRLWDPDLPDDPGRELGRHESAMSELAVTAQGKVVSVVSAVGADCVVRSIDPELLDDPGRELARLSGLSAPVGVTSGGKVFFSRYVSMSELDLPEDLYQFNAWVYAVYLWDPDIPNKWVRLWLDFYQAAGHLAMTPQGKVVSAGADGVVRLHDPAHPEHPVGELARQDRPFRHIAVTEDGQAVLVTLGLTLCRLTSG
jgi:WD40 repeat protein